MYLEEITIKQIVIHVLDSDNNKLILSEKPVQYEDDLQDFLKLHIVKILEGDDTKLCEFRENSDVKNILEKDFDFVSLSQKLAANLFNIMQKHKKIPAADLIVLKFNYKDSQWLALLKVNFISAYTYPNDKANQIVTNSNVFPMSSATKLKEAALINLDNFSLRVREKKFEVDCIRANYFSGYFLRCTGGMSEKEKIRTIKNTLDKVRVNYLTNDADIVQHSMQAKSAINEQFEEEGVIDTRELAEQVFKSNIEAKEDFLKRLERKNLEAAKVVLKNNETIEKISTEKIVTESGITIIVPTISINQNNINFLLDADNNVSMIEIRNAGKLKNY